MMLSASLYRGGKFFSEIFKKLLIFVFVCGIIP